MAEDLNRKQGNQKRRLLNIIVLGIVFLIIMGMMSGLFNPTSSGASLSYTAFKQELRDGSVGELVFEGSKVTGTFRQPRNINGRSVTRFHSEIIPIEDPELAELLNQSDVKISSVPPSEDGFLGALLINLLFIAALVGIWWFMMRRFSGGGQGQLNSFTRGHHKQYKKELTSVTFSDVAGMEGAKEDLEEVVEFLKDPKKFQRLGAKIPRGVLLVGPPGTGKTLISKAVAGEAEVPFFSLSGSEFIEMLVGVGAARVRSLFKDAKTNSPSMIFIDEIDSIGRVRGTGLGGGHDEREQTLNQMLSEMDGFDSNEEVIILAATNRPDVLDPALLRPGRFDRKVIIDKPQMDERHAILKIHARNKPLADDVNLENVARSTAGLAGADLENILNEAALYAARRDKNEIENDDLRDAIDKIIIGNSRPNLLNEDEKRPVAYHEAGHALLGWILPHSDPVRKVSIVPRGMSLGHTIQLPERDKHLHFRNAMLDRLRLLLGGRAAEELFLTDISSGAAGDFKMASQLARNMVCQWGMSEEIGNLYIDTEENHPFLGRAMATGRNVSEKTQEKIDAEVKRILNEAEADAVKLLKERTDAIHALVDALMERETLEEKEIAEIFKEQGVKKLEKEDLYQPE